ncbi:efflux RND transporter periplasmic adaptor subunit [Candidatus Woesebacteria bacterium]|nr:efflux RND transporter periplasmic adaptor subunit [Candidatus Woesebacteria bacterium]
MAKKREKSTIGKILGFIKTRKYLLLIVFIALVAFFIFRKNGNGEEIYTVMRGSLTETVTASGELSAHDMVTLNFPLPGKLGFVNVKNGEYVRSGQVLMGLNAYDLQVAVTNAQYVYLAADANAKEVEDDVQGHDEDESFEQKNRRVAAQTARDRAWENWQVAKWNLANSSLITPINGVVTNVTTRIIGDTVGVTDGVTVVNPETMYFRSEVDEIDYPKIKLGQKVNIKLDAFPEKTFPGKVTLISPAVEETTGGALNIIVEVGLDNSEDKFITGLNGEAEFVVSQESEALTIPKKFIIIKDGKNTVLLKEGARTVEKEVELGTSTQSFVEVVDGLKEGDTLIFSSESN